jgi:hypothetical protein
MRKVSYMELEYRHTVANRNFQDNSIKIKDMEQESMIYLRAATGASINMTSMKVLEHCNFQKDQLTKASIRMVFAMVMEFSLPLMEQFIVGNSARKVLIKKKDTDSKSIATTMNMTVNGAGMIYKE